MAVANQKGGVGKSTTAVSLGAALAESGFHVLVIDLDPQGNASTGLGIRHEARDVTIYQVLSSEADLQRAIVKTPVPNLFAVPSTIDLAGAEIELVSQFSREMRLRRALEPLRRGPFDFILLDCPPSLGLLTINALAAAEELIVPIQCEYYALEGLGQLLRNVRLVQQNVNQDLRLSGIVMTMFDPRTKLSEQVVDEVRKYFGDLVYETIIPRTVRLSEAPGFGQPITVYDPRSRGAECYRDLAHEVASRPAAEGALSVFDETPHIVVEPVAPAVEPIARSAPRPLRVEPDVERDEDEPDVERDEVEPPHLGGSVEGTRGQPRGHQVREPEGEAQAGTQPESAPRAQAAATEPEPSEPDRAHVDVDGPAPTPEPVPPPPTPVEHGGEGEHEGREVVVIDAYDPQSEANPTPVAEPGAEDDEGGRKRWSLFRRGGRR